MSANGRPLHPYQFLKLANGPGYSWIWICFDEAVVATGENMPRDNHAGVWRAGEFLAKWKHRLDEEEFSWLRPFVAALAEGIDQRTEAIAAYRERNDGAEPDVQVWPLPRPLGGV